jgi:hypothetical protein
MEIRQYTDFSGGVNQQLGPVITDSQSDAGLLYAEDAKNMEMTSTGLIKMKGYGAALNTALSGTPVITGLFEFIGANGARQNVVCAGGKIFTVSAGVATQIYTGHTAGTFYQGLMYRDVLILCNGVDNPVAYDGTTCSVISFKDPQTIWNNTKPRGACVFRNRIFYWDDTKIYTPRPGTYDDFNNNENTVDGFFVDRGYGGKITHLKPLSQNRLMIYKERCIRSLSGSAPFGQPDQFVIIPISDEVGCPAPRSVVIVGQNHVFWSERGPRVLSGVLRDGDIEISQPSYIIPNLVSQVNWSQMEQLSAVYEPINGKVIFAYATGSSTLNNEVLQWDADTQTHEPRGQGIQASSLGLWNRQVVHGNATGMPFIHNTQTSYNGSSIESYWKSKYVAHGGIGYLKRYRRLAIFAEGEGSADITVRWSILQRGAVYTQNSTVSIDSTTNAWDSGTWGSAQWSTAESSVFHIKNLGRGSAIKLEFLNTSDTQRPIIRQVTLEFELLGSNMG